MHYTKLLKSFGVSNTAVENVIQPTVQPKIDLKLFRSEDDMKTVFEYFDYLEENYFQGIPYSKKMPKRFLWNIPDRIFKYITKMIDIDAPITCQPLTALYGLCLEDVDSYPNFIQRLVEYDCANEVELTDFVIKHKQLIEEDEQGDE